MPATTPKQKEALARRILDAASAMVAEHGVHGLSMRKLATQVSASTMVLYTHFDGKTGLLEALYREAFARFHDALSAVPVTADPIVDLRALGWAYYDFAMGNPTWYALMFGKALAEFEPSEEARGMSLRTYGILEAFVDRAWAIESSARNRVAAVIWASIHGMIELQMAKHLPAGDAGRQLFATQVTALVTAYQRGKEDA